MGDAWAWTSGSYRALDFTFAIRTTDAGLGRYLTAILATLEAPDQPATLFTVVERERHAPGSTADHQHEVFVDDELVLSTNDAARVVPHILGEVNTAAVRASADRFVLLHASAAARGGRGAIFPAPPEAGKTTLVGGLLLAGLSYVTDEVVAIDPASGLVHPFPKALAVDRGSRPVLQGLRPDVDSDLARWTSDQWHVNPRSVRPDAVADICTPAFVIMPRYESGSTTTLTPMHASDALVSMMNNAFSANNRGRRRFEALAAVARQADCYELTVGDLTTACELILALFDDGHG
jgi:hypothetical protein